MNLPVRLVAFTIGLILASSGIGVGQEKYSPDDEFVKAIATKAIKYLEEQNKATSPNHKTRESSFWLP